MKLRILSFILIVSMVAALFGCSNTDVSPEPAPENTHPVEQTPEVEIPEPENTAAPTEELAVFSFADVSELEFYFSSGAGAWRTVLYINADGSFNGLYSDSDMGDSGDDYPNGTYYLCEFSGKFSSPEMVNNYIYSFGIDSLEYNISDSVEIIDGVRYVNSTPYGIEGGEEFHLYLPGTPMSEIPEEYINWIGHSYHSTESSQEPTLPFYGLYNVTKECGFSSYKTPSVQEMIDSEIACAEDSDRVISELLDDPYLTQGDMNVYSYDLYTAWDNALNNIWRILKDNLDAETMAALTEEEIAWIIEKEAAMEEAGKDVEGGSLYPCVVNSVATEYTRERVYELAEYAKLIPAE